MPLTTSKIPMNATSQAFIHRLLMFCAPKRFSGESTSFDMGYEQAKRDLRLLIQNLLPDAAIIENELPEEQPTIAEKQKRWFGLRP